MKKVITLAAVLVLFAACQQTTEREVSATATTETTTYSAPSVDTAAVSTATAAAETAAREAARQTGTALETAGQEIQEEAKTGTDQ